MATSASCFAGVHIYNTIVTSAGASCLDIDNQATFADAWDGDAEEFTGDLTIDHSIIRGCSQPFTDDEQEFTPPFTVQEWFEAGEGNEQADPGLRAATSGLPSCVGWNAR
jgi:hypothetical protein